MNNKNEYDILVKFTYEDDNYVIYTDNTYDELGQFNLYGAKLGRDDRLEEVDDVDINDVFNLMIEEYKKKIIVGEV